MQLGPTETDMTASMMAGLTKVIPLKRVGQPDEIAALASCLLSGKAGHMTGSYFDRCLNNDPHRAVTLAVRVARCRRRSRYCRGRFHHG
nr:hypothetical protein [Pararhizobium sp. YC-54]